MDAEPSRRGVAEVVPPERDEWSMRLLELAVAALAIAASLALTLVR